MLLEPDRKSGDGHFHGCSLLPGGRGLVFVVHPTSAPANTIGLLADGRSRSVLSLPGETVADPAWSPSGHIVFGRTGAGRDGVWALPFSLERLEPTGEPFQVVAGAGGPSVGADGSLLYTPGQISRAQSLVWVSREGKIEGSATELPDESGGVALSPDGTRIAVAMNDGGLRNIWAIDVGRGTRTKLTPDLGNAGRPAFSPDGKQVAFALEQPGLRRAGRRQRAATSGGARPAARVQPRRTLAGRPPRRRRGALRDLRCSGCPGARSPASSCATSTSVRFPAFSPDGRFVSYLQGEGEATGNIAFGNTMMTRFPEAQGRWQISTRGGDFGTWSPDGRRFYYIARAERDAVARHLMEVDVRTSPEVSLGVPRPLFDLQALGLGNNYAVAPGGHALPDGARGRRPDDREARARPELVRGVPMIAPGQGRWVACASDESGRHEA